MTHDSDPTPETLLAHATWMRGLAFGLVRDPNEADDVVQDATLAALRASPPGGATRAWLATVVRNFAWRRQRAAGRRRDHEAHAAREPRAGRDEDPAETLARIDLQRALLDRVRALDEPLRTTVVQRYFEGRTSVDIARAAGVPAATVRARLKRALDALRGDLDRDYGSRGAWMALIAPFVPLVPVPPVSAAPAGGGGAAAVTGSTLTQGALTMTLAKIVAPVALTGLVALAAWRTTRPDAAPPATARAVPAVAAAPVEPASEERAAPAARAARTQVEPAATRDPSATAAEPAAPDAPPTGSVEARFVDELGAPWAGVALAVLEPPRGGQDRAVAVSGTSDAAGRVSLTAELPAFVAEPDEAGGYRFDLVARHPDRATRRLSAVLRVGTVAHLGDVVLERGARVRGRVVDAAGLGVPGALVGVAAAADLDPAGPERRDAIARAGDPAFDELLAVRSAADGGFDLDGVTPGRLVVWAHAPGLRWGVGAPVDVAPGAAVDGLAVVLGAPRRTDRVSGQVVGPDGAGRRATLKRTTRVGADVAMSFEGTDDDGRFEFAVEDLGAVYALDAHDAEGELGIARVEGVRPGDRDVVIAFTESAPLRIRVRDDAGRPVADAAIWISTFGSSRAAEPAVEGPGTYVVARPAGSFHVEVGARGFRAARRGPFDGSTTPDVVDVALVPAPRVVGRVLAGGEPVAGARVEAFQHFPDARMTVNGFRCTTSAFGSGSATTGADGRFELYADLGPGERFVVRASHGDWTDGEVGPLDPRAVPPQVDLELTRGGTLEGVVVVAPGESAGGRVVVVHRGDGRPRSVRTAADGTWRFEGLVPGDWHVELGTDDVDPYARSYSSYAGDEPLVWSCRVEAGRTTRHDLDATDG